MARGWESKSVEMQMEAVQSRRSRTVEVEPTAQEIAVLREKESLKLSRIRVVRELEISKNPRYQQLLARELKALDAKLGQLS